jgi:uncharacterized protein YndB with AHSA1/START domain
MLWILLYIVIGIVAVLLGIILIALIIAALMPADFRVTRSATIAASPADVFPHVNDLRKWEAWSPWDKIDPDLKRTYEGAPEGTGAIYSWEGNKQVGAGRMTITDSKPAERIDIQLEFFRPFAATNQVEFTFIPQGSQTVVSWTMIGKKVFITKLFSLVMSMDKMLGGMFEQGLAQLKGVVEGAPKS